LLLVSMHKIPVMSMIFFLTLPLRAVIYSDRPDTRVLCFRFSGRLCGE
jgi:hypothetical protein